MKSAIYEYDDYKTYLEDVVRSKPNEGRGFKARIAEVCRCQTAYVSQVFHGNAHLSAEQSHALGGLLGLRKDESRFLRLLIQHARAGTAALREDVREQIEEERRRWALPKKKGVQGNRLSAEDQVIYYSHWEYGAVHMALTLPSLRTQEAISAHLGLSLLRTTAILGFLNSVGLARRERDGSYRIGESWIHIDSQSPMNSRNHANWRFHGLQAIDRSNPEDLHFTSVMTISRTDAQKLKAMTRDFIRSTQPLIRDSAEETMQCLLIDLYAV